MKKAVILIVTLLMTLSAYCQEEGPDNMMTLNEYLGFVKTWHPVARQANLKLNSAQANLMQARGGFDPKIQVDYDTKNFKDSEYYSILNSNFKIPTWYGIELKAGYEKNEGYYLNPENTVPEDGLYSAGISMQLGQGLFINERMATLKKAKIFTGLTAAERELQINQILFDAITVYIDWYKAQLEVSVLTEFVNNAGERFKSIKTSAESGDIAAIDSVEARIQYKSQTLNLEQAALSLAKARLKASNFLWLEEGIPLELKEQIRPDTLLLDNLAETLKINDIIPENFDLDTHPKLRMMRDKIEIMDVDRQLKAEKLKPRIDLTYNFLTSDARYLNTINTGDYKFGLSFEFPLFLRKERGGLKLAKLKIQDAGYEYDQTSLELENKIKANYLEVINYKEQLLIMEEMVSDYNTMLNAEIRKFNFGESSVFLVNSREKSYLDARLKAIELNYKIAMSNAKLFQSMAILP
ncbi:TolC family protein [Robertkochia solimangrovi]|uniref:TolC family protein n=1 Tax=Robertkochia solimangrovi TaxID=2213046 RepID=UPI00117FCA36|nr:TolC family protein [Robertkochia solimangrovi]TRZ41406.1 transporter [Robertkochia solimangrovi]